MRDDPGTAEAGTSLVYYPAQKLHGKGHFRGNLEVYLAICQSLTLPPPATDAGGGKKSKILHPARVFYFQQTPISSRSGTPDESISKISSKIDQSKDRSRTCTYSARHPAACTSDLAMHYLGTVNPLGCVAGVDDQLSFADNLAVVVVGVIGDDHDAVVLAQLVQFGPLHLQIVLSSLSNKREVGIVVADLSAFLLQQFDDGERGRLAQIIDVSLVGHAQNQDAGPVQRFLMPVQCSANGGEHVIRHVVVDFSREFDEAGAEVK